MQPAVFLMYTILQAQSTPQMYAKQKPWDGRQGINLNVQGLRIALINHLWDSGARCFLLTVAMSLKIWITSVSLCFARRRLLLLQHLRSLIYFCSSSQQHCSSTQLRPVELLINYFWQQQQQLGSCGSIFFAMNISSISEAF